MGEGEAEFCSVFQFVLGLQLATNGQGDRGCLVSRRRRLDGTRVLRRLGGRRRRRRSRVRRRVRVRRRRTPFAGAAAAATAAAALAVAGRSHACNSAPVVLTHSSTLHTDSPEHQRPGQHRPGEPSCKVTIQLHLTSIQHHQSTSYKSLSIHSEFT